MKNITLPEYREQFGLFISEGELTHESRYGICSLIRQMIYSNDFLSVREIRKQIHLLLQPLSIEKFDQLDKYLEILCDLNEIKEFYREGKKAVFMATRPRWIKLNDNNAVLLGNVSNSLLPVPPIDDYDVVRRVALNEDTRHVFMETGIEEATFPTLTLPNWEEYKQKLLSQNVEPLSENIIIVSGKHGDFWGSGKDSNNPTGRWKDLSASTPDGTYFGCKNQLYAKSWFLLHKQGKTVQTLMLHDEELWHSLFLARTIDDRQKPYSTNGDILIFSIPLPIAVETRLRFFASKQPQWGQWRFNEIQLWESSTIFL